MQKFEEGSDPSNSIGIHFAADSTIMKWIALIILSPEKLSMTIGVALSQALWRPYFFLEPIRIKAFQSVTTTV